MPLAQKLDMNKNPSPLLSTVEQHLDKHLQVVFNSLPVAISWARISDARILFTNRKFTELFGYDLRDFQTIPEWVDKTYPNPEQRAEADANWYKYLGNPTSEDFEIDQVEVDVLCKDGKIKTTIHGGIILSEPGWALATFVDISSRKKDEQLIRSLAEEDPLTKLANRRSFDTYLAQAVSAAIDTHSPLHLLILDLDHFKEVNDTLGHQAGDELLKEVAVRLKDSVRSSDIVARLGGDEFGIILKNAVNYETVGRICTNIIEAVAKPFKISGQNINIGISIGASSILDNTTSADSLFAAADKALYKTKEEGRGHWNRYTKAMG